MLAHVDEAVTTEVLVVLSNASSAASVLLLVPPMLKYLAGPLLGPAHLVRVGRTAGVPVRLVDLNAQWLRRFATRPATPLRGPLGDHARPAGGFGRAQHAWDGLVRTALRAPPSDRVGVLPYDHDTVLAGAQRLAEEVVGPLAAKAFVGPAPMFVGISVMWSGQVLAALALSLLARRRWPGVPVVWGGAHVAALAPEIAADPRYGTLVDGFVAGYAEETFRLMLTGDPLDAPGVFRAGCGQPVRALDRADTVPAFGSLRGYGAPRLTLPVQLSRGCAYGRCAYCTYPAIEGGYRPLSWHPLEAVVRRAVRVGADVAIKDAYVTPPRLAEIAERVDGRVRWAACTRLVPRIGRERLAGWVDAGLGTLEIGVESFDAQTLRWMDKRQTPAAVDDLLEDAAGLDLHLVLNVMFGFPGQHRDEAEAEAVRLTRTLPARFPDTRMSLEINLLEVERRSRLARDPERFGIRLGARWPWSSIVEWEAPSWRSAFVLEPARKEVA